MVVLVSRIRLSSIDNICSSDVFFSKLSLLLKQSNDPVKGPSEP